MTAESPVTESLVPAIDVFSSVISPMNVDLVQQSGLELVIFP